MTVRYVLLFVFVVFMMGLTAVVPGAITAVGRGQTIQATDAFSEPTFPAARTILDRALERASIQEESGIQLVFEYLVESTVESLDKEGATTEVQTARSRQYALEGVLYEELVERDGQPLDEDDARKEQEKKESFVRKVREHAARGEEYEPDDMNALFDENLMDRYNIEFVGTEVIRDYACWVLRFEPRPGKLPEKRRIDKALNRSTGQLWITQDDYGVARVSFEMQKPFRYVWGLVATLRSTVGQLDFERVDQALWTPLTFDLTLDMRVFFKGIRRHIQQEWIARHRVDVS